MARTKTTPRMTTGGRATIPRPEPAIALNRDGSVRRDPQQDRKERIRKMKADFLRAKKMMEEAQKIMAQVEITFLDLEKTDFQDVDEILKTNN